MTEPTDAGPDRDREFESLERRQRRWATRWDRLIASLTKAAFFLLVLSVLVYFAWIWDVIWFAL